MFVFIRLVSHLFVNDHLTCTIDKLEESFFFHAGHTIREYPRMTILRFYDQFAGIFAEVATLSSIAETDERIVIFRHGNPDNMLHQFLTSRSIVYVPLIISRIMEIDITIKVFGVIACSVITAAILKN